VRAVRSAEVESARLQTELHDGQPFRDNSNDQWGPPGSMGKLHAVLLKQQERKKEKGRSGGGSYTWTAFQSRVAAAALKTWGEEGGGGAALVTARKKVASRLGLGYEMVKPHMQQPRAA